MLAHWSKTQQGIAWFSVEADLNPCVRGVSGCIGALDLSHECGLPCTTTLQVDVSAAKGMGLHKGCGKVKHLSTRQVSVQVRWLLGVLLCRRFLGRTIGQTC